MDLIPRSWTSAPEITSSLPITGSPLDSSRYSANGTSAMIDGESSNNDGQLFQDYSDELLTFATVMCIIFTLIGIPGNLITIVALSKCNKARNATAIFIINLSFSDLLFCCFNLPLATSTFLRKSWDHGDLLCRLFPLMRYGLLAVSLFTILLITINRYVMIGHPRVYPKIYRNRYLGVMVAATWIGAFSILIPTYRGIWGTFGLDTDIGSCSILPDKNGNSPKEFLFIMAFVVPCFCIIICYARIFYIVRKTAFRSREPANINSSMRFGNKSVPQNDNNDSDQNLINKTPKVLKDENSELSSTISHAAVVPNEEEQTQKQQWQMRPFLSKLRSDEMKYIDTSVESDIPSSLLNMKTGDIHEQTLVNEAIITHKSNESISKLNYDVFMKEDTSRCANKIPKTDSVGNGMVEAIITQLPLKNSGDPSDETDVTGKKNIKNVLKTSINRVTKKKFRNNSTINTSNASILYPGRMSQKDKRLLKMILVIFMSFVVCYLPITITKLWKGLTEMHWLNISGYLLIYLTTCINPFIYVVMSSEYRQAYWNLLRCKISKQSAHNRYAAVPKKNNVKAQLQT